MRPFRCKPILGTLPLIVLCSLSLAAQTVDVAVVVNPKNLVSNLSVAELRKLFTGEMRTWPDGTPVKLLVRAPGAHEREVLLQLLRMSEDEYESYWTAQADGGEGRPEPVTVYSNGMQKEAVIAIPGAIALIDATDVKPGVKILKVAGKLPSEQGYPLH